MMLPPFVNVSANYHTMDDFDDVSMAKVKCVKKLMAMILMEV
jgi:hypothetical protein